MIAMELKPRVSVCVMTYNQGKYIRQCLQSIVDQKTNFIFEVIVGEDCSTDDTKAIVQEFSQRYPGIIKPIFHESNLHGGFYNYQVIHQSARGDFVAHVDGDDYLLPGKLQMQADFLFHNADYSVVWHRVNLFDDDGGFFPGQEYDYSMFKNGEITLEHALRLGTVAMHSSIMYRKSARKTYDINLKTIDLFYTWEYLRSGRGKILDDVLGCYRINTLGSIRKKTDINKYYALHAAHYLRLIPSQRSNIFIFSLLNFFVNAKNFRKSAFAFLWLVFASFGFVSPMLIVGTFIESRKLIIHKLRYENQIFPTKVT